MYDPQNVFAQVLNGQIPAARLHEDEHCIVIRDIHPQAREHLLIIPKTPVRDLPDLLAQDGGSALVAHLLQVATQMARKQGLQGFRTVINTGAEGGQSVFHLHVHVLGGEELGGRFGK